MKKEISILCGKTAESSEAMEEEFLFDIAEGRPENLFLVETNDLLELAKDDGVSPDLRRIALSELVARWFVSGDDELASRLSVVIGDAWRSFSDWYNVSRQWTGARFHSDELPEWNDLVCFRFYCGGYTRKNTWLRCGCEVLQIQRT